MPRKRQISSTPEELSDEEELSDVPSPIEDEEEDQEEEVEEEEDDANDDEELEEEDEEEEEDQDDDFEQQSEEEVDVATSESDEEEELTPLPQASGKGRVTRKVAPLAQVSRPPRTGRAEPVSEAPKIKLKLSLVKEAMEEIKVENPPKATKSVTKVKAQSKPVVVKGKKVEPAPEEEDDEEQSSSLEEEDESSDLEEDDVPVGTEMDLDEEEDEEEDFEDTDRSRTGTPMDTSRLTKRQQAKYNDSLRPYALMSLPNGPPPFPAKLTPESLRKRPLTADEIALRRSETARKRKNQSEQRLEEEKIETINRLLKPQAPKRRGQRAESPVGSESELVTKEPTPPPPPMKVRTVRDARGTVVGIPEKWVGVFFRVGGAKGRSIGNCGVCGKLGKYPVNGKRACSVSCVKVLKSRS
jgi:Ino eighty subunit 2